MSRANKLAQLGHDVIHLEVGEPDFNTPMPIINAARGGLNLGITKYTDARGTIELRAAISSYYADHFNIGVETDRIFVTGYTSHYL